MKIFLDRRCRICHNLRTRININRIIESDVKTPDTHVNEQVIYTESHVNTHIQMWICVASDGTRAVATHTHTHTHARRRRGLLSPATAEAPPSHQHNFTAQMAVGDAPRLSGHKTVAMMFGFIKQNTRASETYREQPRCLHRVKNKRNRDDSRVFFLNTLCRNQCSSFFNVHDAEN